MNYAEGTRSSSLPIKISKFFPIISAEAMTFRLIITTVVDIEVCMSAAPVSEFYGKTTSPNSGNNGAPSFDRLG